MVDGRRSRPYISSYPFFGRPPMDRERIIQALRGRRFAPSKAKQLARLLKISQDDYVEFKHALAELAREGRLVRLSRNRYALPESHPDLVTGRIEITRGGLAFLIPDDRDKCPDDVLIPRRDLHRAVDGDQVMVSLKKSRRRREGEAAPRFRGVVEKILQRKRHRIVGTLRRGGNRYWLDAPGTAASRLPVPKALLAGARPGQKVVVRIPLQQNPREKTYGTVVEVLGEAGDRVAEERALLVEFGVDETTPEDALEEERVLLDADWSGEFAGREDLRGLPTVTIDPADAYDFDDAVSVARIDGGWKLWVHIADVSRFVRAGGAVDALARRRLNSVYLPGRVVPMLPEGVTHRLACLMEGEDRLAKTVEMEFARGGVLKRSRVFRSVVRSDRRLDYDEAAAFLAGTGGGETGRMLRAGWELAQTLKRRRFARGAIDMNIMETKVLLDESGEVRDVVCKARRTSDVLVEEFMLAANERVALHLQDAGVTFVGRVHDEPDEASLRRFRTFALSLGLRMRGTDAASIQRVLSKVAGGTLEYPVNYALLRSMKKAVYTVEPRPHFALAFERYTHFTSPIRRYVDLTIHRALDMLFDGDLGAAPGADALERAARDANERELATDRLEREYAKLQACCLLRNRIGSIYDATIVGVSERAFWVLLDRPAVEGVVPERVLGERAIYDEESFALHLRRSRCTFRMGQRLKVRLFEVDVSSRSILFEPV